MSVHEEEIEATLRKELDIPDATPEEEDEEISPLMQEAMDSGWKDKDAFIESGGDPDKHVSPHEYVRYGKLQKTMREQQRRMEDKEKDYEKRFENLNKLHEVQREQDIAALQAKQRAAVEEADTDGYDQAQREIDALNEQKPTEITTTEPTKDPAIVAWEGKHDWIDDPEDIRTQTAQGAWNTYVAKNPEATIQNALDYVDGQLAKLSPQNPLRDVATATEKGGRASSRKKGVTMSDLTQEERDLHRNAFHDIWGGDEKAFLKSVEDARK